VTTLGALAGEVVVDPVRATILQDAYRSARARQEETRTASARATAGANAGRPMTMVQGRAVYLDQPGAEGAARREGPSPSMDPAYNWRDAYGAASSPQVTIRTKEADAKRKTPSTAKNPAPSRWDQANAWTGRNVWGKGEKSEQQKKDNSWGAFMRGETSKQQSSPGRAAWNWLFGDR
jgi:hypothetical protein